MNNKLPSSTQIYAPLLKALYKMSEVNRSLTTFKAYDYLAKVLHVSSKQLEYRMNDGRNHWQNRVQGAKGRLVKKGFVETVENGLWGITEEGVEYLKTIIE